MPEVGEQQRWGGLGPGGRGRITLGMRKSFLAEGAAGAKARGRDAGHREKWERSKWRTTESSLGKFGT